MTRDDIFHFDGGNRLIKSCTYEKEDSWLHAIQEISKTEYENELKRDTYKDLYVINDKFYRVGYRAEAYSNVLRGASRYENQPYYQVMLGVGMFSLYDKGRRDLTLFAGHAPQDIDFQDTIRASAMSKPITIEQQGTSKTFRVKRVEFWDEPIGGIMNQILTSTGKQVKGTSYASGSTIVFDVGGFTLDCAVVENNKVRTEELDSFTEVNLLGMERALFYAIRSKHPKITASTEKAKMGEKLRDTLMTGKVDAGGYGIIDMVDTVNEILYDIVNFIMNVYEQRGGTFRFHNVILTGGGATVIEPHIRKALTSAGRENGHGIYLAGTRENAHFANVFGASKLSAFYVRHGRL